MGKKTTTIKTACIAGVSGGPDSMAMLHALRQRIVCVCHVNYHKRPTANRDQNIVKQYCKQNQIPLAILNVNKSVYQKYQTINNFQSKARIIRFDFFAKIAQKYNARFVITAHHFNDFIETAMIQKQRKVRTLFLGIKE
jgi:tRNA(Ile)-lysidine synthase